MKVIVIRNNIDYSAFSCDNTRNLKKSLNHSNQKLKHKKIFETQSFFKLKEKCVKIFSEFLKNTSKQTKIKPKLQ